MKVFGVKEVNEAMEKFGLEIVNRTKMALDVSRIEMENEAKRAAPWTDRTANARNSITGSGIEESSQSYKVALAIGMHYGKYLELCNFGKYRIVWPTVEAVGYKLLPRIVG